MSLWGRLPPTLQIPLFYFSHRLRHTAGRVWSSAWRLNRFPSAWKVGFHICFSSPNGRKSLKKRIHLKDSIKQLKAWLKVLAVILQWIKKKFFWGWGWGLSPCLLHEKQKLKALKAKKVYWSNISIMTSTQMFYCYQIKQGLNCKMQCTFLNKRSFFFGMLVIDVIYLNTKCLCICQISQHLSINGSCKKRKREREISDSQMWNLNTPFTFRPKKRPGSNVNILINEECKAIQVKQLFTEECVHPLCTSWSHTAAPTGWILQMARCCAKVWESRANPSFIPNTVTHTKLF